MQSERASMSSGVAFLAAESHPERRLLWASTRGVPGALLRGAPGRLGAVHGPLPACWLDALADPGGRSAGAAGPAAGTPVIASASTR
jgi:hypothetical protein